MNEQKCPKCKTTFCFKNMMVYDPEHMKVLNIIYLIECQKCKSVIVTKPRVANAKKNKQARKILKEMEEQLNG